MSTLTRSVSADSEWALLASAEPSAASIGAVLEVREGQVAGADLVSLIVASEKALSLLQARQATLLAEFARPGRAGDVSALVAAYTEGFDPLTRRPDGEIDTDVLQFVIDEQAQKLAAAEVAAALHVSPITARRRVTAAVELTAELPGTHAALAAGRIDRARAWVIADRTAVLDRETRGLVEDRILPIAVDRTPGRLRELVDRAVIAVDPEAAANRGRKARADRRVEHQPLPDGMGRLQAFLPADGAVSVFTLVDLLAGATAGLDERGVDARRADALTDIADALLTDGYCDLTGLIQPVQEPARRPEPSIPPAEQTMETPSGAETIQEAPEIAAQEADAAVVDGSDAADAAAFTPTADSEPSDDDAVTGDTPAEAHGTTAAEAHGSTASESSGPGVTGRRSRVLTRHGRRPHLTVTLSLATLAGLDQLPGALAGYGAVTADLARAIAASLASINTVIVDPASGAPVAVGDTVYRHSQDISDKAITAAGTCRFPSCRQPAWRGDLDHRTPHARGRACAGGETSVVNTDPLCRAHHLLKTLGGWSSTLGPWHDLIWTSPTGHRYQAPHREFTLPDEWTTSAPETCRPSIGITASDLEHRADCGTPTERPEHTRLLSERQLRTLARMRKQAATAPPQPSRVIHIHHLPPTITLTLENLEADLVTAQPLNDEPPF